MWNCALTKHAVKSARGPPVCSDGTISTQSDHGSVYSGYSLYVAPLHVRRGGSSTQREAELGDLRVRWRLSSCLSIGLQADARRETCNHGCCVALSNLHTVWSLRAGLNDLQLLFLANIWSQYGPQRSMCKAKEKPPHHIWKTKDNHNSYRLNLKQVCMCFPTGEEVFMNCLAQ